MNLILFRTQKTQNTLKCFLECYFLDVPSNSLLYDPIFQSKLMPPSSGCMNHPINLPG